MPLLRSGAQPGDTGDQPSPGGHPGGSLPVGSPTDVSALHFPPYCLQDPALWSAQIVPQFEARHITTQSSKFAHVVSALPMAVATEVRELIMQPPTANPYDTLKRELLDRTTLSTRRRLQQLLTAEELGGQKPTQLLHRMRQLVGESSTDATFLQELFLQRLPTDIRLVLTAAGELSLDELAKLADRIAELKTHTTQLSHPSGPSVLASRPLAPNPALPCTEPPAALPSTAGPSTAPSLATWTD